MKKYKNVVYSRIQWLETGKVKEFFLILGGEKKYLSLVHEANISHSLRLEHTEWIFLVRGILFQDGQVL